jgi:hypothetical protein
MRRNSHSLSIYSGPCLSYRDRRKRTDKMALAILIYARQRRGSDVDPRVGVGDKPRDRCTWVHRSSESRNVSLPPFIRRGNEGPRGSVLFMGDVVIIRLCGLMNARVHTLMQLQIMHISRIYISSFPFALSLLRPYPRRTSNE